MWNEVAFVRERVNARIKADAVVMQSTIASVLSKEGGQHFKELLEKF